MEDLQTKGTGFNFKLGMICRISDWFRIGAAFHSPSWFGNMRDNWVANMTADYEIPDTSGITNYSVTNNGYYNYKLTTPWRVQGNLGFIIGNIGLIGLDYEYVDYASSRFRANDYNFIEENSSISNSYTGSHQFRLGTEWRYKVFSFRAGASYFTSPYKNGINDSNQLGYSGGLGFRHHAFFMDLAFVFTGKQEDYYLYNTADIYAKARNSIYTYALLLTLGVKL